jgi:protein TonB
LQQKLELRARWPRRKFISANTKEFRFAAYMEAWRAKVERVGNINYPDEARRNDLSGSLLLDVAINPDGSVREITVRRTSGQPVLDDAAVRIVELAAPFARFPDEFLKEIDILHVTRTWKFLNNDKFSSR